MANAGDVEFASEHVRLLRLLTDPVGLQAALKSLDEAMTGYTEAKEAAALREAHEEDLRRREAELAPREADLQQREAALSEREGAMADRERKFRIALGIEEEVAP
jgi:hypothetical protein